MKCKKCDLTNTIKKGKRNEVQRYYCKNCSCTFQESYTYKAYDNSINDFVVSLLKESCSVLGISRILKISKNTVLSRILKISDKVKIPYFNQLGCKYEVDEMFVKIANGAYRNWITYAIEKETRNVVGFLVGSKSKEKIKPLIDKLLLLQPKRIYTDKMPTYPSLIPKEIHRIFKYCTNRIERKNLTLRTHIKRLNRKTICFTKNEIYLEAHLKIYFWG